MVRQPDLTLQRALKIVEAARDGNGPQGVASTDYGCRQGMSPRRAHWPIMSGAAKRRHQHADGLWNSGNPRGRGLAPHRVVVTSLPTKAMRFPGSSLPDRGGWRLIPFLTASRPAFLQHRPSDDEGSRCELRPVSAGPSKATMDSPDGSKCSPPAGRTPCETVLKGITQESLRNPSGIRQRPPSLGFVAVHCSSSAKA